MPPPGPVVVWGWEITTFWGWPPAGWGRGCVTNAQWTSRPPTQWKAGPLWKPQRAELVESPHSYHLFLGLGGTLPGAPASPARGTAPRPARCS